jgi:hypothetical protein
MEMMVLKIQKGWELLIVEQNWGYTTFMMLQAHTIIIWQPYVTEQELFVVTITMAWMFMTCS